MTLKWAQTLDGRIATAEGDSRWVSGRVSRLLAHRLRAEHDAILVGIGTVLADNPELTVRLTEGPNPVRIVLDGALRTPLDAAVLRGDRQGALIATQLEADPHRARALTAAGATIIRVPSEEGRLKLDALLVHLHRAGIRSLLVEGGAQVATSFLRHRLVDGVAVFIAPKIVGSGIEAVGRLGISDMGDAIGIHDTSFTASGEDLLVRGKPSWG